VNRVAPIGGLASHLGRGVQRIATDAIVGRVRSLPRTVEDLDAKSLSQIMGRTVTSVAVIDGDAGTTSRARLALTGDGVPETVFVKLAALVRVTAAGPLAITQVLLRLPGGFGLPSSVTVAIASMYETASIFSTSALSSGATSAGTSGRSGSCTLGRC